MSGLAFRERPADGPADGLLILHHGRGADDADLLPAGDAFDPRRRLHVVTPRGPLTLPGWPGYHWYVVPRVGFPDPATFRASFDQLAAFHDTLWERTGIPPERTVLGGFSMGSVMSYALGLAPERPRPAGLLIHAGFLPTVEGWAPDLAGRAGLPVRISHGVNDPVMSVEFGRQAAARLEDNPDVINSPVIAALRSDIARLEAKLQELAGQLGKNHPQYQRQETEVVTLRQKMVEEMRKIASSLGAATQVNQQRESEVRGALAAQKKKVLELKQQRDEIMVLVRDVETAQRAYDLVNQRASQTSLESQTQQTNVVVLTPADEPISPASPRPVLYSIIAFFAGGMLGIALALVAELKNRRIRSAEDLADTLEIPVVATLTAPRRERGIRRLVRRFRPVAA
mgnify:CR=1 FL=1